MKGQIVYKLFSSVTFLQPFSWCNCSCTKPAVSLIYTVSSVGDAEKTAFGLVICMGQSWNS